MNNQSGVITRICLFVLILVCAGKAHTLRIDDFLNKNNNDIYASFEKAFTEAQELPGESIIELSGKTYTLPEREDSWCCLKLHGISDLIIEGNGSTVLLKPGNNFLYLSDCSNIEIRNLKIDYSPLPFIQGRVLKTFPEDGVLLGKTADGFSPVTIEENLKHCALLEENNYTHKWFYLSSVEELSKTIIKLKAKPDHKDRISKVKEGMNFVFAAPQLSESSREKRFDTKKLRGSKVFQTTPSGVIQASGCENLKFRNIRHYISPSMTYRLTGCRKVQLERVQILKKPGRERLAASLSDGMHIKDCDGVRIESCHFEALLDDSINISSMAYKVLRQLSPAAYKVRYSDIVWYDAPVKEGQTALIFDPLRAEITDRIKIEQVKFTANRERIITLARPPENLDLEGMKAEGLSPSFFIQTEDPAIVTNCTFRNQMKVGIVVRTPARIRNCDFSRTAMGVHSFNSFKFAEGPIPEDLVIRNNTFSDILYCPISVSRLGKGEITPAGGPVTIDSNQITMHSDCGISVSGIKDVNIVRNIIYPSDRPLPTLEPIKIRNCSDVTLVPVGKGFFELSK
ncbi:right-handed parallel beta-helix repeat-containing protein [Sedimentisphaera salicampi]|uniref:Right handed beta helix domain-containing protein n=1 Tax=Sedimentisphaera salicampi TaxID=1941349 RepID=A0A1W6LM78_9BACT|nr:right-handed parallel beta-helix repeat-containing protein [Sedimentisphaera salicampi]ARN56856.1 hypothetical protein STSP1_01248 [Sedimentisphaera salicampi]OXU15025.1 hypothetical protein SMSP1_01218 [Sedimentisphaera salicampi]